MRLSTALALGACLALLGAAAQQSWPRWSWELRPPAPELAFTQAVHPFIVQNCRDCHDDSSRKGDFSLEPLLAHAGTLRDRREAWERVLQHVQLGLMPPPEAPAPAPAARADFVRWLDHALHPIDPRRPDPGRVVIRRLSRLEYAHTVRDVLGVDFDPVDFPEDDTGYGYDHIGDVLNTSPLLFERLLAAARTISEAAITDPQVPRRSWSLPPENWTGERPGFGENGHLWSNGAVTHHFEAPATGRYRLTILLAQDPRPGPEPARAKIRVEDRDVAELVADAPRRRPRRHNLDLQLERGPQTLAVAFINDYYKAAAEGQPAEDRNLHFLGFELEGPFDPVPPPPSAAQLALIGAGPAPGQSEAAWLEASLARLARPLFRREVAPEELARLSALVEHARSGGATREGALQVALQAMLVSPSFLYRGEAPPDTADAAATRGGSARAASALPISEQALATRLAYFLWAGPPDTRLLDLARDRALRPALASETERLLADPRARRFVASFAGQWLLVRNLRLREPDATLFPDWSPQLAAALEQEVLHFVGDFLTNGRPVTELLSASETFMDARVAAHYGLPAPAEPGVFVRASLPEGRRAGLLGLPGVLAVSSYPNRTSPVLRGKFVLEQLLGTPPPPPPANIPSLDTEAHASADGGPAPTLRQRLELHRAAPSCAACHAFIDPIGYSLEGFAADGRARATEDDGRPLDTEGRLEDGRRVRSPEDLAAALLDSRADLFRRQLATQLLTFALGRGTDYHDRPALDRIVREARAAGDTLPAYLHAVVRSFPFQHQRPPEPPPPALLAHARSAHPHPTSP